MLVATFALFKSVPTALAPKEDQGYIMVMPILQDAASLQRTEAVSKQITDALAEAPGRRPGHGVLRTRRDDVHDAHERRHCAGSA